MEINILSLFFALVMGVALGGFYVYGLWWTLKGIRQRSRPFGFLGLSYLLRTGICLAGFWLVLKLGIAAFCLCLAAFTLVRFLITRQIGIVKESIKDVHHA